MTLGEFHDALELAKNGAVASDSGAGAELLAALERVANTERGQSGRAELIAKARQAYRAQVGR